MSTKGKGSRKPGIKKDGRGSVHDVFTQRFQQQQETKRKMEEAANKEMLSMQEDLVNQLGLQQGQIAELNEYISNLWEKTHTHMRGGEFEKDEDDEEYGGDREILTKCKHQNDLEELGGDIEELKLAAVQLEEARKEIRELQDKLADSEAEKDRHAKQVQKSKDDMAHLEEEIARLKTEARSTMREKETVDEQVDNLKREYKRVQAELKDKSSRMDSDHSSEDLTKMKQENEVLKVEVARAQAAEAAKAKELADHGEVASRKAEQLKQNSHELDTHTEKVAALERSQRAKDAELAAAKEEVVSVRARHSVVQEELEDVRAQTNAIRRQTTGAADELEEERNTTALLKQKLKTATQDAEDERESARTMKRERDRLQADVDDQETTVRKLRTEVNEISNQSRMYSQSPFMVSPQKDNGNYGGVDTSLLDSSRLELIHVAKKQIALAETMLDESVVVLESKDGELNMLRAQLRQAQIRIEELERQLADAGQDKGELDLLRSQNIALQSELESGSKDYGSKDYSQQQQQQQQQQRARPPNMGEERDDGGEDRDDGDAELIVPAEGRGGAGGEGGAEENNLVVGADGNVTEEAAAASGRTQREYEILLEEWEDQTWFAPVSDDPSSRSFPVNVGPTKAAVELQILGPKWLVLGRHGVQLIERDGQHNCVADWRLSDIKRFAEDTDMVTVDVSTRANAYAGGWALDTSRGQAAAVFNHLNRLMKPVVRRARNKAAGASPPPPPQPQQQQHHHQQYAFNQFEGAGNSVFAQGGFPYTHLQQGQGQQGMMQQSGTDAYYF